MANDANLQCPSRLDDKTMAFYRNTLLALERAKIPFLIGGAYALACYTGIERHTKDIDVFILPEDFARTSETLRAMGCETELSFPHWLGKAFQGDQFIDIIFSSGNGLCRVDADWFKYAVKARILAETPVNLCAPEEMIWSKSYIMERERYDGADIAHLVRACGDRLDWQRLIGRFGGHWPVLLSHLTLYTFIYPAEKGQVPVWVIEELNRRQMNSLQGATGKDDRLCQGTLLSREQYLTDLNRWGYRDARLQPIGPMTREHAKIWTDAIHKG